MSNGKEETEPYLRELKFNQHINMLCYKWFQLVQVCSETGKPADELEGLSRAIYFLKTLSGPSSVLGPCPQIHREFCILWPSCDERSIQTQTHATCSRATTSSAGLSHLQGGRKLSKPYQVNNSSSFDCPWMRESPEHVSEAFQEI